MEKEEIKNILDSNKSKYFKYLGIIYIILGAIYLIYDLVLAFEQENLYYIVEGIIALAICIFFYFISTIIYEIHIMNKYIVSKTYKKEEQIEEEEQEIIKNSEADNEDKLSKIIKYYEDKK